jgi:DNA-binding transcriptional MerR regulator
VQTRPVLTIGEFAQLTHLSIRTLRRYHEAGLLEPARVDQSSGYRYYSPDQIPSAQVIHRLRELDLPLADVKAVLATSSPDERAALVSDHLQRLEDQLARTRAAVASLQRLLKPTSGLSPEIRSEPATSVAAIDGTVGEAEILSWYAGAMAELDAALPAATGAPGGLYDNELFTEGRGHALVYRAAPGPIRTVGRVHEATLPPVELALVVHPGDHDTINVTYAELGQWVATHALAVAGPVRERYLCGPRDTPDASAWRTEIGWPVFRLAGTDQPAEPR